MVALSWVPLREANSLPLPSSVIWTNNKYWFTHEESMIVFTYVPQCWMCTPPGSIAVRVFGDMYKSLSMIVKSLQVKHRSNDQCWSPILSEQWRCLRLSKFAKNICYCCHICRDNLEILFHRRLRRREFHPSRNNLKTKRDDVSLFFCIFKKKHVTDANHDVNAILIVPIASDTRYTPSGAGAVW